MERQCGAEVNSQTQEADCLGSNPGPTTYQLRATGQVIYLSYLTWKMEVVTILTVVGLFS